MKTFRSALLIATAAGVLWAAPARAFDPAAMSDAERAAFRAEVRAYLLANPEVLMEAIAVLEERQQAEQANAELDMLRSNADAILNDPDSWAGGNLDGDITVVEFVDYRCGYCRKAHDEVQALVGGDGNIRLVLKEYPILGEDSMTAARFAIAMRQLAGDDIYKRAHDALITLRGPVDPDALAGIARDLGVDPVPVIARMSAPEVTAVVAANRALGQRLQINGTPTFVIHETIVRGYVPLDGMQQIVAGQRRSLP